MEGQKEFREIASCIRHRLSNTVYSDNFDTIRLFPDGAGGQKKNTIVITALLNWLLTEAPKNIKNILLHFPVPGHSYIPLPPDRVFGVIERKVLKIENIIHPNEYIEMFKESGTVTRRRNNIGLVQGEVAYTIDLGVPRSIAKKGQRLGNLYPRTKVNSVPLNSNKVKDVKKLLEKHYGDQWMMLNSLRYCVNLFHMDSQDVAAPSDDADDNVLDMENDEDQPMGDDVLIVER
ncbi:hypothetical protein ANN_19612 [Periplaneta americana]|uniref:Uncharacterized protein n=1 Tax=Periplaneta americana TaxID=6978 RepID=A0ABQ8SAD6_PERAM|nr:hypothetical protein ANN_19612 [Periplaneta americana]